MGSVRLALMVTCVNDAMFPRQAISAVRAFAGAFEGYDAIVTPSGSCAGCVRHQHAIVASFRQWWARAGAAGDSGPEGIAPQPHSPQEQTHAAPPPLSDDALLQCFVDRVRDYRATVDVCRSGDLAAYVREALGHAGRVVVPDELGLDLGERVVPDHALTATDLDEIDAVVTRAAVGIAETGTIVLDHGPDQGRRALSLVPDLHVCIVTEDQVVPDVQDALSRLDPTRPMTWISGPSATSDIELERVEGVHGPRTLHVVLVMS